MLTRRRRRRTCHVVQPAQRREHDVSPLAIAVRVRVDAVGEVFRRYVLPIVKENDVIPIREFRRQRISVSVQ